LKANGDSDFDLMGVEVCTNVPEEYITPFLGKVAFVLKELSTTP
jgi:hypothetical protein